MSDLLTNLFYGRIAERQAEMKAQRQKTLKVEEEKLELLNSPGKLDDMVAEVAKPFALGVGKPKESKFASKVEALEASRLGSDPGAGAAFQIRDLAKHVLASPEFVGKTKEELVSAAAEGVMRAGDPGNTLLDKVYRAKRAEEGGWFSSDTQDVPGYREWLADAQAQEKVEEEREGLLATPGELAVAGGVGAAFGGLAGGPLGAMIGGAGGVAGEMLAAPLRKMIYRTEWYKGQRNSDSLVDKAQAIVGSLVPDVALGLMAESGVRKGALALADRMTKGMEGLLDRPPGTHDMFEMFGQMQVTPYVQLKTPGGKPSGKFARTHSSGGTEDTAKAAGDFIREAEYTTANLEKALTEPSARKLLDLQDGVKRLVGPKHSSAAAPAIDALLMGAEGIEDVAKIAPLLKTLTARARQEGTKLITAEAGKETPAQALLKLKTDEAVERALAHPKGPAVGALKALDEENAIVYLVDPSGRAAAMKKWRYEFERKMNASEALNRSRMTPQQQMPGYDKWLDRQAGGKSLNYPVKKVRKKTTQEVLTEVAEVPASDEAQVAGMKVAEDFVEEADSALGKMGLADPPVEDAGKRLPRMDSVEAASRVIPKAQKTKEIAALAKGAFTQEELETLVDWAPDSVVWGMNSRTGQALVKSIMKTEKVGAEEAIAKAKGWIEQNKATGKSLKNLLSGIAAFGVTAGVFSLFSPQEAEAGVLSSIFGAAGKVTKEARYTAMKELFDKGLVSAEVTVETEMSDKFFQRGMREGVRDIVKLFTSKDEASKLAARGLIKDVGSGMQFGTMSPYQAFETILKTGARKMVNPAVYLASHVAAGNRNTKNATQVVRNILAEGGIETARKQVQKAMEPVADLMMNAAKYDVVKARIEQLGKMIPKMEEKLAAGKVKNIAAHQADIDSHKSALEKLIKEEVALRGATEKYHAAWTPIAQDLAKQHGSVRVALALDDTASFSKYPWLKDMLTYEDKVAAGKVRKLLDQYQVRLSERKVRTIKEGYFPHTPHPLVSDAMYARMAENETIPGVAFAKFYSRTPNSRPLMPDVMSSMEYYLRDVEKRIQFRDFWKGPEGWKNVMLNPLVRSNYGLNRAFLNLYEGTRPAADTWGNRASNIYTEFEVFKRLFLNPSAGLKHLVKVTADIASVGVGNFATALGPSLRHIAREGVRRLPEGARKTLSALGVNTGKFESRLADDFVNSIVSSSAMHSYILDLGLENQDAIFNSAKQMWRRSQNIGSTWISLAEFFDRSVSVTSGLTMALKRGMTVDQALYGSYDLILKNNFLGREFNPRMLNNPKFRALMMFQATPFKIFERRLVNAWKTQQAIGTLSKEMKKAVKERGWGGVFEDLKNIRKYMYDAESDLKTNLFVDALTTETDFFGTPIFQQTFRDAATIAAATYGGHSAGLSLYHHFFHIPYLSTQSEEPILAFSPGINAVIDGYQTYKAKEDEADFLATEIVRKWLGPAGPIPDIARKIVRLSENDIPEIYQKGGPNEYLKFFFAIPGHER